MEIKLSEFVKKLSGYKKEDIIFSAHSLVRSDLRGIDTEKVKEDLINPKKLVFVELEKRQGKFTRYSCYFKHSNTLVYRYIINLNSKILIVTAYKLRVKLQRKVEKRAKIRNRL